MLDLNLRNMKGDLALAWGRKEGGSRQEGKKLHIRGRRKEGSLPWGGLPEEARREEEGRRGGS